MQHILDPEWYKKEVRYVEHHPLNKYVRKGEVVIRGICSETEKEEDIMGTLMKYDLYSNIVLFRIVKVYFMKS